jgi:Xaa-Pro aminopeptidase
MTSLYLTEAGCRQRRQRLFDSINADWVVVTSPLALSYFSAFRASPFTFHSQNGAAALLICRDGSAVLFADNLHEGFARQAFATELVLPTWYCCVNAAPHRGVFLWDAVYERLRRVAPGTLAIEGTAVPNRLIAGLFESDSTYGLEEIDRKLHRLRRRKDPDEIAQITECLRIASIGVEAGRQSIRPGMTEIQAYHLVHEACCTAAGQTVELYGDFASGPRCEQGGGAATSRTIEAGDLVLLDFSVVLAGYRGDFANTFVCGSPPTDHQRTWFDACLSAMHAGEQRLRPGVAASDVHAAVRSAFTRLGLDGFFPHHAGHGVGLGHPDSPFLVPESDEVLETGDVVTLEPGLYAPGQGGMRFERNYVITDTGMTTISTHTLSIEQ